MIKTFNVARNRKTRPGTRAAAGTESLSPPPVGATLGGLARASQQEKERKGIWIGKQEVKLSLFTDGMLLHVENAKDSTKKLLKFINKFSSRRIQSQYTKN